MVNSFFRLFVIAAYLCLAGALFAAEFIPLPQLPGSTQGGNAFAVSADGSTVVGMSHNGRALEAVRWTIGPRPIVEPLGAGDSSVAWGVSADGSVIVGNSSSARGFPLAFRWTQPTGPVLLGDFPGAEEASVANGVSEDGAVVVGRGRTEQAAEAFRWTSSTGLVSLGDLSGGAFGSEAYASSANGAVVVGSSLSAQGTEAFRWTAELGMVGLGELAGGGLFSEAYDVSSDGSVVVGRSAASSSVFPYRAFRWTSASGMIALPDVIGIGPTSIADAVSGNGAVIVGGASEGDFASGFAWDAFHGSRSIGALLTSQGVDLDGFHIGTARGISDDGLTIVGNGIPRDGMSFQPWIAKFDPGTFIPEPSSIILCVMALLTASFLLLRSNSLLANIATRAQTMLQWESDPECASMLEAITI